MMHIARKSMALAITAFMLLSASAMAANPTPSCGWDSCGTRYNTRPNTTDDLFLFTLDLCNFIAKSTGTCCCFAGELNDCECS